MRVLPPKKVVVVLLLRFTGALTVLLVPWPGLEQAYGRTMSAIGNVLVGEQPIGTGAYLHFDAAPPSARSQDPSNEAYAIELSARRVGTRSTVRVPIDLRTLTFVPTAVFLALALASPTWKSARGPIIFVSGLLSLQLFLLGSIAVPLLLFFSNPRPMQLLQLHPAVAHVLDVAYRSLVAPPGMAFAIPGLLWVVLMWMIPARSTASVAAVAPEPSPFARPA